MPGGTLRSGQPEVYAALLSEHFDKPSIDEERATCSNCEMCDKGNMPEGVSAVYFRPDLKCCTYHPSLPNYLTGAILADTRPDMQAAVIDFVGKLLEYLPDEGAEPPRRR